MSENEVTQVETDELDEQDGDESDEDEQSDEPREREHPVWDSQEDYDHHWGYDSANDR